MKSNFYPRVQIFASLLIVLFLCTQSFAQEFTRTDTLRGSITPERAWWDVTYYNLKTSVHPAAKTIRGSNTISYKVLKPHNLMQIDLQVPMKIDSIVQEGKRLSFSSEGDAHFVRLQKKQKKNRENQISIYFSGAPKVAKRAPWDGGFTWKTDSNGKHFIANANQGIGASVWWPLKDHPADEPDKGMTISITAPKDLMDVSNGKLAEVIEKDSTKTWVWKVENPINAYGVNVSIGDYVHWSEVYPGEKGALNMDYYVLRENEAKGKKQFKQAPLMMEAFEHWFGPYPFYEDGYKLVEVPYLGMEHQSCVTYGNHFENGYLGRDLSGSGWGLKFDFIIIHESAHEWFANNITNKDVADMWIHEGFTCYSENLFLDYFFGKQASSEYVIGLRKNILNDSPLIGQYNVNSRGSSDIYYKGANILHTLRQWIDNDEKWRQILRGLNKTFYHQTVSSQQVENYIETHSGLYLKGFWDQYLRSTKIPTIEFAIKGKSIKYRYTNILPHFEMPVVFLVNGKEVRVEPTIQWQVKNFEEEVKSAKIKEDFYVYSAEIGNP